ncbi:MAG: hypothetical protein ACI83L_002698 [Cryomorphaceae bacterium]
MNNTNVENCRAVAVMHAIGPRLIFFPILLLSHQKF